jgi:hypothetical protein
LFMGTILNPLIPAMFSRMQSDLSRATGRELDIVPRRLRSLLQWSHIIIDR